VLSHGLQHSNKSKIRSEIREEFTCEGEEGGYKVGARRHGRNGKELLTVISHTKKHQRKIMEPSIDPLCEIELKNSICRNYEDVCKSSQPKTKTLRNH
jgi:hypothetical protein